MNLQQYFNILTTNDDFLKAEAEVAYDGHYIGFVKNDPDEYNKMRNDASNPVSDLNINCYYEVYDHAKKFLNSDYYKDLSNEERLEKYPLAVEYEEKISKFNRLGEMINYNAIEDKVSEYTDTTFSEQDFRNFPSEWVSQEVNNLSHILNNDDIYDRDLVNFASSQLKEIQGLADDLGIDYNEGSFEDLADYYSIVRSVAKDYEQFNKDGYIMNNQIGWNYSDCDYDDNLVEYTVGFSFDDWKKAQESQILVITNGDPKELYWTIDDMNVVANYSVMDPIRSTTDEILSELHNYDKVIMDFRMGQEIVPYYSGLDTKITTKEAMDIMRKVQNEAETQGIKTIYVENGREVLGAKYLLDQDYREKLIASLDEAGTLRHNENIVKDMAYIEDIYVGERRTRSPRDSKEPDKRETMLMVDYEDSYGHTRTLYGNNDIMPFNRAIEMDKYGYTSKDLLPDYLSSENSFLMWSVIDRESRTSLEKEFVTISEKTIKKIEEEIANKPNIQLKDIYEILDKEHLNPYGDNKKVVDSGVLEVVDINDSEMDVRLYPDNNIFFDNYEFYHRVIPCEKIQTAIWDCENKQLEQKEHSSIVEKNPIESFDMDEYLKESQSQTESKHLKM